MIMDYTWRLSLILLLFLVNFRSGDNSRHMKTNVADNYNRQNYPSEDGKYVKLHNGDIDEKRASSKELKDDGIDNASRRLHDKYNDKRKTTPNRKNQKNKEDGHFSDKKATKSDKYIRHDDPNQDGKIRVKLHKRGIKEGRVSSKQLDDEDIDNVSASMRKKYKDSAAKSKHRKKKKKKKDRKISEKKATKDDEEKKMSDALTLEAEKELGFDDDAVGNPCVTSPCSHGGTCTWNREGQPSFTCGCKIGYRGTRCEQEVEECDALPCKDRGDCVATPNGFLCLCKDGYGGKFCEVSQKTHTIVSESKRPVPVGGLVVSPETLQTVYITVGVVGGLVGVVTFSLCIHCCRVWNKRLKHTQECKDIIGKGGTISELPPDVCDISDALCREFWCCSCVDVKVEEEKYGELLGEFKKRSSHVHVDSPYPKMKYSRSMIQSDTALPVVRGSFQSFRSLPLRLKSPRKKPSWLREVEHPDDTESIDSSQVVTRSHSRTLPRISSPARRKSLINTPRRVSMDIVQTETVSEDSLDSCVAAKAMHEYPSGQRLINENIDIQSQLSDSSSAQAYHSPCQSSQRSSRMSNRPIHLDNRPSHHSTHLNNRPSHHSTHLDNRPSHHSTHLDNRTSHHSTHLDNRPSHHSSHLDNRPSHHSTHLDNRPSRQSTHVDNRPSRQSTHVDNRPSHHATHVDIGPSHHATHVDNRPSHHATHVDNRPSHHSPPTSSYRSPNVSNGPAQSRRPSLRSILAHLARNQPPLPDLSSETSSTFSGS